MTVSAFDGEQLVREISLQLPEATERETWGDPTFRIRDKIFVMVKRGDGRTTAWLKPVAGVRDALLSSEPDRYFVPPYVGSSGWLGIVLETPIDPEHLRDLICQSFRNIAPKRVASLLDPPGGSADRGRLG